MDFEEFRENLMEDLRDQIYQRTGNDCTVEANGNHYGGKGCLLTIAISSLFILFGNKVIDKNNAFFSESDY